LGFSLWLLEKAWLFYALMSNPAILFPSASILLMLVSINGMAMLVPDLKDQSFLARFLFTVS
jgi:hypothetical protein